MSTLLTATVLVPLLGALYLRRPPRPAAGLASALVGLGTAVIFFAAVALFGTLDPEWETVIWTVQVGGRRVEIWQEYALLIALPASFVAFLIGQRMGRTPSPLEPITAARTAIVEAA